jgi:hypothetical protein
MYKIEFRLTMPGRGSASGGWSGSERNYLIFENISNKTAQFLGLDKEKTKSWSYGWDDGWTARITGRVMEPGEKRLKSDGFGGYNWMVVDIICYNEIRGKR